MEPIATWQQAELLAVAHMTSLGFEDAAATPSGRDGGIDVSARGAVAQVKHYMSGPIGAPAVQQLVGAAVAKQNRLFYSYSGYTPAAVALAEERDVCLFEYSIYGEVTPVSTAARVLSERGWVDYALPRTAAQTEFVASLQRWGQRVIDTAIDIQAGVAESLSQYLTEVESGAAQLDPARLDAFTSLIGRDVPLLGALIEELDGEERRVLVDLVRQISRIEGMAVSLAEKTGQDYSRVELRHLG